MALRFERATAKRLKTWMVICRMASLFRKEDRAERAARKSWRSSEVIFQRRPYLFAAVIKRGRSTDKEAG